VALRETGQAAGGEVNMRIARSLIGTVLVVFSSAALAHVVGAAARCGGTSTSGSHAAAASSAHAAARAADGTRGASSSMLGAAALKAATVTHISIRGEPATVVLLAPRKPLTAAEREKIRKAGYVSVVERGAMYFCQRTPSGIGGFVNDCFTFANLSDPPKDSSPVKGDGNQRGTSPDTIGAQPSRSMVAVFSPAS
jgi:hypothetical protein